MIPDVPLLLTGVTPLCPMCPSALTGMALCCLRFPTATHVDDFESYLCSTSAHRVALSHLRFSLQLTLEAICYSSCPTTTLQGGSASSLVSYCCSPWCFCLFPGILLSLHEATSFIFRYTAELTGLALFHPMCLIATHRGGIESFQVSHCYLLGWFCIIMGISLSPTGGVVSASSQVFHCH